MGTVWLAERSDAMTKRRVALKLPHVTWGDAFVERLAREREILATLEHEHIARLYDAGVDALGRPFLAMEYVEGEVIDAWCRTRDLSLEDRLDLLLQVMSAVAHAHAMLVVHRDLKPGNILVTAEGRVRLLDFGVAKLLEGDRTQETVLTEFAGRALTFDYASPEQIRGEPLGTASDIYSMAIVAFELLAGERPYRNRAALGTGPAVSVEPPLASSKASDRRAAERLRGDLDAILNKAMKPAPADRYPTMDAFAQDLRRHLAGEPVEAQPDRFGYRAGRFVRRHRVQVAAGAMVVLSLVVGLSVALWQAREAREQARRAESEATTAKAVQNFLKSVFESNSSEQIGPAVARDTTARQLLDRGADRIATEVRDAPAARLDLLVILADMYEQMSIGDRHIAMRREALAQAEALYGSTADETVRPLAKLAHALTLMDQRTEAMTLLQRGDRLLSSRGDQSSSLRFRIDVMQASLERRTDPKHGLILAERALALARQRPPDGELLFALRVAGDNAYFTGDYAKARDRFEESIRVSEAQAPLGISELALVHGSLGEALTDLGDYERAEAEFRKGLALEQARKGDPAVLRLAQTQSALFFYKTGRFREGLDIARPSWEWALGAPGNPQARWVRINYGSILRQYGRMAEILTSLEGDGSLTVEADRASQLDLGALNLRTHALIGMGRLPEARASLDRTRALLKASNGRFPSNRFEEAERDWLVASGRGVEALAAWNAARKAESLPLEPDASSSIAAEAKYASIALAAGELQSAGTHASTALQKIAAKGHPEYQRDLEARVQLIRGKVLLQQGRAGEACPVIAEALRLHRTVFDPDRSPDVADAVRTFAQCPDGAKVAASAHLQRGDAHGPGTAGQDLRP